MNTSKQTLKATTLSSNPSEIYYDALGKTRLISFQHDFVHKSLPKHFLQKCEARRFLVFDESLPKYMIDPIYSKLEIHGALAIPAGEKAKSWLNLKNILDAAAEINLDRSSQIIALGGGAIGDVVGLAASLYMRGISWINVPTSSLAQADSSIGGKTAINSDYGKNMIGTFHPADITIMDASLLSSLPKRDLRSGIAEVVKHAILGDIELFEWLEKTSTRLLDSSENLKYALRRSCEIKLEIIGDDWQDKSGARQRLNLGHTFAHALEKLVDDQKLLNHGEAVAIGLCMAADMSLNLGYCSSQFRKRIYTLLQDLGFATDPRPFINNREAKFEQLLANDKKNTNGTKNFVYINS